MNTLIRFSLGLFIAALSLNASPVFAACQQLAGKFGYRYDGTLFSIPSPFPSNPSLTATAVVTENGAFTIGRSGQLTGEGTVALRFSNFFGYGPFWVLVSEKQLQGVVTPRANDPCSGTIEYNSTFTVIDSSDTTLVPPGLTLTLNDVRNQPKPRTVAYVISGLWSENVEVINTDTDTIVSGTAHKQP